MRIYSVSAFQQRDVSRQIKQKKPMLQQQPMNRNVNFKSDKGTLKGVIAGAAVGALGALAIVATGGLAAAAAAVGATGVAGAGAGLGAQIGGIIGGIASSDEKDD